VQRGESQRRFRDYESGPRYAAIHAFARRRPKSLGRAVPPRQPLSGVNCARAWTALVSSAEQTYTSLLVPTVVRRTPSQPLLQKQFRRGRSATPRWSGSSGCWHAHPTGAGAGAGLDALNRAVSERPQAAVSNAGTLCLAHGSMRRARARGRTEECTRCAGDDPELRGSRDRGSAISCWKARAGRRVPS